jgi:outer membrane protein
MKTKMILLILFFLINSKLLGQSRVLTYEEAINIALHQSYTIKTFQHNKLAAQYSLNHFKAQFKPRLDFNMSVPSWNEMVTPIQRADGLPVYNSTGSIRYSGDLAFTYILPTGGNLALSSTSYLDRLSTTLALNDDVLKTRKAYNRFAISFNQPILTANTLRENLERAGYYHERFSNRFTRGQMDIIFEATRGFYQLYRATREVEILRERAKNTKEAYRIARIKVENGRSPEIDVLRTKVDLDRGDADLSASINSLEREKDNFKHLIGLNLDEDIQIITDLKYESFEIDLNKAIQSALENRLELNEAKLDIDLQKLEVHRAKRYSELRGNIYAYYDFTGVSSIESGSNRELFDSSFNNFVDRKPNRGITLTLSYPIFDWGRGSARVQEETVNLRNNELGFENTRINIIREVRDVVRSLEDAKNRLNIYEQGQQVAQQTYEISRMQFENGNINSQELALEQDRLATSQLAYLNAFITYQFAIADLKRKTLWDFQNNNSYLEKIKGTEKSRTSAISTR